MKHWNIPVSENLDKQVFETAHDLRTSKSNLIRTIMHQFSLPDVEDGKHHFSLLDRVHIKDWLNKRIE